MREWVLTQLLHISTQLPMDDILTMTSLADEYEMPGLLAKCKGVVQDRVLQQDMLKMSVEPHGVLEWALIAQHYHFDKLLAECEWMIIR